MAVKHSSALELILLVIGLLAVAPTDAFAYVDPGTGSYLFQLAAGGLLAAAFTVRRYWEVVKALLGSHSASQRSSGPPSKHE